MIKVGIKLRIKPPKRRSPSQRLRARIYYRKNRSKIKMQRRRYLRIHKTQIKHRKQFMRYKPSWFKKPKKIKSIKKLKVSVPKMKRPKPFHMKTIKPLKMKPHKF